MSDAPVSVRLPDQLLQEVDDFAKSTRRSRSFVVKEALEAYMQDQRDYLAAIEEGEREADLGVLVSADAVKKWLLSWGTDNELPRPEPDIFPADKP